RPGARPKAKRAWFTLEAREMGYGFPGNKPCFCDEIERCEWRRHNSIGEPNHGFGNGLAIPPTPPASSLLFPPLRNGALGMQRFKIGAANLLWFLYSAYMSRKWKRATHDVSGTQLAVLKRIVSRNVDADFGREHHFAEIDSVEVYQRSVPIRSYEEFQPYIERVADGHPKVLTAEKVMQFGLTSGSTQASKLVPYTKALVSEFQEGIDPWVYYLLRRLPRMLFGKTYWSVTPVGERKSSTPSGIPVGFDDEQQYFSPLTRWVLDSIMAVPSQLAQLSDMETFRYVTLRLLLQEKLLSWVSVWNPSFLTLLLDPLPEWFSQLIEDIRHGTLSVASEVEPALRNVILPFCKRNPGRAKELESVYAAWQR